MVFRGVPFAAAASGRLRFAAPRPPQPWDGVRAALSFGVAPPQERGAMSSLPGFAVGETGEDCLSLNVWTPGLDDGRRPVMVWIPGGGFTMGSGSQQLYDGAALARRGGVVVVTLNYRLGAMGFLHGGGLHSPGVEVASNAGLLDQVAALRWVRDNITAFGGDPDQVTVFGESAGAMSVATLLAMPAARGLFRRAIAQSGAARHVAPAEEGAALARSLLAHLGLGDGPTESLADIPLDLLLAAQDACTAEYTKARRGLAWRPVIDGVVLPRPPCDAVADGDAAGVPLLIGTTADEWRLFGLGDPRSFDLDDTRLASRLEQAIGAGSTEVLDFYRAAYPHASPSDLWFRIETDRTFRVPAALLALAQSKHQADTYCYLFTWQSAITGLGSCHGLEIPFVFGNLHQPGMAVFAGDSPEAHRLSDVVQDAWLTFARHGKPSHPGLPAWVPYGGGRGPTMTLGETCELIEAPLEEERALWERASQASPAPLGSTP